MIYVYAITEGVPAELPAHGGLGGARLRTLEHGALAAVYSEDPPARLEPTENALWRHEQLAEELMAAHAVLPMRFGTRLEDEQELRELLIERAPGFAAALAAVRGKVELGVRATIEPEPGTPAPPASGRAYITGKLERRRAAARLGETLHAELGHLASASTFKLVGDPRPVFAGSYLVERGRVEAFRQGFEPARAARPGVELACTGPWPPFSFTDPLEAS